jgi:hypothetical protein
MELETTPGLSPIQKRVDELKWYVRQYVGLGLRVLPLWGVVQQGAQWKCLCGSPECDRNRGKHPLTTPEMRSGVNSATDDVELLDTIISRYPGMNIGVAVPDGMVVVDIDPRNGGDSTVDEIEARYGKFPDTWDQLTGGGGRHLCFQVPFGTKFSGKLGPGVDIKQAGGYIVVEPSVHPLGKSYGWESSSNPLDGQDIARVPEWLERIGGRPSQADVGRAMKAFEVDQITRQDLESALAYVDSDDRDNWIRVGLALKTIGDAGFDLWDRWSQRSSKYKAGETVEKWHGFKPQALAGGSDPKRQITYRTVFGMAQACGWVNASSKRARDSNVVHLQGAPTTVDEETGEIVPHNPLFTPVHELLDGIRPIDWLVEGYLEQDALGMLFGPSGGGKSFVAVSLACSVATGAPWFGCQVKQGAVFYIAGEGHQGLARRFAAWSKATGVKITKDTPLFKSNRAVQFLDANAAQSVKAEVAELARRTGHMPVLIQIDTLARNFGDGDENKQADANRFIEAMDEIRREFKCHVQTVHHSGHEMERARGSSAFRAAMDQELWVKGSGGMLELAVTKMKDAEMPASRRFKIAQLGLGVEDDCGVEITGAYLEIDGNPLEFKVGSRTNGGDITALDVAKAMHPRWPGVPPMASTLGCSERSLSRIMKAMKDQGLAVQASSKQAGWELSETALDHLSMTGAMLLNKGGEGA